MARYNIHEAKTSLSRLVKKSEQGEEVIIMRNGEPVAELVPYRRPRKKKIDPFDRMLVAQAVAGNLTLVTSDEAIHRYGVKWVW